MGSGNIATMEKVPELSILADMFDLIWKLKFTRNILSKSLQQFNLHSTKNIIQQNLKTLKTIKSSIMKNSEVTSNTEILTRKITKF